MTYTTGEKIRIGWLVAKAFKQSMAGDRDVDTIDDRVKADMDRITDRAEQRRERNARAAFRKLDKAEDELADAEAAFRAARGPDKAAARRARNDAKQRRNRADAAARKFR